MPLKGLPTPHETSQVQKAIDYIHEHHTEKVTAESLAIDACIDLKLFRRLFFIMTGEKVHDYVIKVRLDRATEDLDDFSLTVEQIAYRNGFSSGQQFCRIFKEKKGMAPTNHRYLLLTKNVPDSSANSPEMRSNSLESAKRAS